MPILFSRRLPKEKKKEKENLNKKHKWLPNLREYGERRLQVLSPVPLFLTPWTEDDGGADGADERATVMGMMG